MKKNITYNYISDYLKKVQSKGRYTITLAELKNEFDVSEKALLQNIFRLKSKQQLAQVRKGFYVIIPPQYSHRAMIPPSLFIDDMMKFINKNYYIGLFSAAALHGAGHQQPMEFQVITKKPALRKIKNEKLNLTFFTKSNWQDEHIADKKTEAGYINVSTPELTAFDLVFYHKNIGGLNRIVPVLEDLTEEIKSSTLVSIAKTQKTSTIQRLGYLLDILENENLALHLNAIIKKKKAKNIPLSILHKDYQGEINEKWKVIVNTEIVTE